MLIILIWSTIINSATSSPLRADYERKKRTSDPPPRVRLLVMQKPLLPEFRNIQQCQNNGKLFFRFRNHPREKLFWNHVIQKEVFKQIREKEKQFSYARDFK